jgi:hypothetical protein
MLRAARLLGAAGIALVIAPGATVFAQDRLSLQTHVLFYGDNTEFRNPFREGETILGAAVHLMGAAEISDRATLTLGVFANQRFGSDDAFELVRPMVMLSVRSARSSFFFGTLPPSPHPAVSGPDRNGPHGLLPPLQRETLAFDRPYEAGLQWTFEGKRSRHDTWLNWQRLNTPEHRERFDAGASGEIRIGGPLALPFQVHVVHEGGQLFALGPVKDSIGAAIGATVRGRFGRLRTAALEAYGLVSRFVPDRSTPERTRNGAGVFARASGERAGWRGHILFWRGCDFIKDEGDPNYLSIRRDGTRYRGTRDYSELGVTRTFKPASGLSIHASARLHRTERHYEYSYRILGVASLRWQIRQSPLDSRQSLVDSHSHQSQSLVGSLSRQSSADCDCRLSTVDWRLRQYRNTTPTLPVQ